MTPLVAFAGMTVSPESDAAEGPTPRPKGVVLKPRFVLNLDDDTAEQLRERAHVEHRSKNAIAREALIAYLEGAPCPQQ